MLSWAVALVCLCMHAHAQLGEGVVGRDENPSWEDPPPMESDDYYYKDVVYDNTGTEEDVQRSRTYEWKPIDRTYQGCLFEDYISEDSPFLFVNLSEIVEVVNKSEVVTKADACFDLCLHKEPFSFYITMNLGLSDKDTDACGCHSEDELQLDLKQDDDSNCDENSTLYRVFCGPENIDCLNKADAFAASSINVLLFSILISTLMSAR